MTLLHRGTPFVRCASVRGLADTDIRAQVLLDSTSDDVVALGVRAALGVREA